MRAAATMMTTVTLALGVCNMAMAQVTTSHQIPYQGRLDLDGVAQNGPYTFRFSLFTSPTQGNCTAPTAECLWNDTFIDVPVASGSFSVLLGSGAPLSDAIWQYDAVYLGIEVMHASDADFTLLAGRQRVAAVPFAARAETAKDYHVTGDLVVDGTTTLSDGAIINNGATISGLTTAARVNATLVSTPTVSTSQIGISSDQSSLRITDDDGEAILTVTEAGTEGRVALGDSAHLVLTVRDTSYSSAGNTNPEVYRLTAGPICVRGGMFVGRATGAGDQDSLCVCLMMQGGALEWHCFNP